jgi:hypothetical protein
MSERHTQLYLSTIPKWLQKGMQGAHAQGSDSIHVS